MTESSYYESVQVFIGVNRSGKRLFDRALLNDENKFRALISDLKQHGQILLVVDRPATIAEAGGRTNRRTLHALWLR